MRKCDTWKREIKYEISVAASAKTTTLEGSDNAEL
jgi:hypothetical protein